MFVVATGLICRFPGARWHTGWGNRWAGIGGSTFLVTIFFTVSTFGVGLFFLLGASVLSLADALCFLRLLLLAAVGLQRPASCILPLLDTVEVLSEDRLRLDPKAFGWQSTVYALAWGMGTPNLQQQRMKFNATSARCSFLLKKRRRSFKSPPLVCKLR